MHQSSTLQPHCDDHRDDDDKFDDHCEDDDEPSNDLLWKKWRFGDLSAQSQLINLSISANLEAALDATQSFDSCIISQI